MPCLFAFRFSKVHLLILDIATKKMEPDNCTTSASTDNADGPTLIKEEFDDDGPQSEEQWSYLHFKNDRPIINITPIVSSGDCVSKPDGHYLTIKSEPDDNDNSTETSIETAVKSEVVTNVTPKLNEVKNESPCPIHSAVKSEVVTNTLPNLYEVKNESSCSTHTKIVHNNIDAGSELVEVPGELDCKPEIIDNVGILGDVNIQTSVQHNDTVNHKPLLTSMNNCEVDSKETTALGK